VRGACVRACVRAWVRAWCVRAYAWVRALAHFQQARGSRLDIRDSVAESRETEGRVAMVEYTERQGHSRRSNMSETIVGMYAETICEV
jgi:hypothetical protein